MEKDKRLVKLDPQIIERFETEDEMLMIKGGGPLLRFLARLLSGDIDLFNCGNCRNCNCVTNDGCNSCG